MFFRPYKHGNLLFLLVCIREFTQVPAAFGKNSAKGDFSLEPFMEAREDTILELLALSGDFPDTLLDKLPGSPDWTRKVVRELVRCGLVRRYQHDRLKSLRLTKKARTILLAADYGRFHGLLDGAGELRGRKTDLPSRQRMHHIASAYVLMLETDIVFHQDQKPCIGDASNHAPLPMPCFYSSYEIKNSETGLLRVKATRAVGALIFDRAYLVYHCGNSAIKWSSKSEHKLAGIVESKFPALAQAKNGIQGIMIGEDMGTILKLLESTGGYRNSLYRVDDTFPAIYFLPLNADGRMLLMLRYAEHTGLLLRHRLLAGKAPPGYHRFVCDALDGTTPILFAHELDMVKLKHFHDGLEQFEQRGRVLCLDFQAEAMKTYFGNLAEVQPLDSNIIRKEILLGT